MSIRALLAHVSLLLTLILPGVVWAQADDCPDTPPSILIEDGVAETPQRLYAGWGARTVVAEVPAGELVNVLWQTECVDGLRWRKLVYNGTVGYAPEFVDGAPTFAPYTPPEPVDVSVPGRRVTLIRSPWLSGAHSTALTNGFWMQPRPGYTYPDAISPYPNYTLYYVPDYYIARNHPYEPYIAVYPIDEWRAIGGHSVAQIDALRAQLAARPALPLLDEAGERVDVIDLPVRNAVQRVAASQQYVDFQNGAGVRFISLYAQSSGELGNSFVYTFNGITDDGAYYVKAYFPILVPDNTLPVYDAEADLAAGEDPMNSYDLEYQAAVTAALEALAPYQTTPGLQTLDDLIASLYVGDPNT